MARDTEPKGAISLAIAAGAAAALAACASSPTPQDSGRAAQDLIDAPVQDNLLSRPAAEPSIRIIDREVDTPLSRPPGYVVDESRPSDDDDE